MSGLCQCTSFDHQFSSLDRRRSLECRHKTVLVGNLFWSESSLFILHKVGVGQAHITGESNTKVWSLGPISRTDGSGLQVRHSWSRAAQQTSGNHFLAVRLAECCHLGLPWQLPQRPFPHRTPAFLCRDRNHSWNDWGRCYLLPPSCGASLQSLGEVVALLETQHEQLNFPEFLSGIWPGPAAAGAPPPTPDTWQAAPPSSAPAPLIRCFWRLY